MRPSTIRPRSFLVAALVPLVALIAGAGAAGAAPPVGAASYTIAPIVDTSTSCGTQNAEVEAATDPQLGFVYQAWMGCGISFARSTDGGASYGAPTSMPGSTKNQAENGS